MMSACMRVTDLDNSSRSGGGGGISSSILSVKITDKFALSQSDARISVAYKISQWKSLTKCLMKCPPDVQWQWQWCFYFLMSPKRTNQYVLNHLNVTKSLMKHIKSRKLKYFGHVKRHQNILKSVLEGVTEGRRCRGRQRSVWCDNIKGWTGRSVPACSAAAQNITEWRSIVANLRTEDGT